MHSLFLLIVYVPDAAGASEDDDEAPPPDDGAGAGAPEDDGADAGAGGRGAPPIAVGLIGGTTPCIEGELVALVGVAAPP